MIDVSITPNRGDAASVYGIARDLAAAGLGTLKTDKVVPVVNMIEDCALGSGARRGSLSPISASKDWPGPDAVP